MSWQDLLASPEVRVLVAEQDGEILGYTTCGANRDPGAPAGVGEVRTMFVAPAHWRGGVGRALLEAAFAELRRRGCSEATLWSFDANERANAFYEAMGFARDGAEKTEEVWAHLLEVRYRRTL